MNLKEGTRRLALLLGAAGALFGGFVSYLQLQSVLQQRASHVKFERLANSDVIQQARKSIEVSESRPPRNTGVPFNPNAPYTSASESAPAKFDWSAVRICPSESPRQHLDDNGNPIAAKADLTGCYTEMDRGGIKTIHWTKDLKAESIETDDGQTLYPTPAPGAWSYILVAVLPLLGFLLPWGVVRAIGWVGAGFVAGPK